MRKTKIKITEAICGMPVAREVDGTQLTTFFGYHKPHTAGRYYLTHLPTGALCGHYWTAAQAKEVALALSSLVPGEALAEQDWRKVEAALLSHLPPNFFAFRRAAEATSGKNIEKWADWQNRKAA